MTNLVTTINQLATETILEIFEYLSLNDIIYAFYNLNQRFNSILLYQHYLSHFKTPTTDFYVWQNILLDIGSNIEHLFITTMDFCFSLDLFPNLKSFIISSQFPIDHNQLCSLTENKQFHKLISFKIQSEIYYKDVQTSLFENIFHSENSLQIFESISKLYFSCFHRNKLMINKNIISLSLKLTSFNNVFSILQYVPNLKYFNLNVTSIDRWNQNFDLSQIKLEKFKFTCKTNMGKYNNPEERFHSLINLIKQFSSSLIYLSIDLSQGDFLGNYSFIFDGVSLQKEFLKSMIQLKTFHFYIELQNPPPYVQNLLSTFENQFWFDHQWSIGIHGNFEILNSPSAWYRVTSIHFSRTYKLDSNLIEQIKLKIPNLTSITCTNVFDRHFQLTQSSYLGDIELNPMNKTLDTVTIAQFIDIPNQVINKWLSYILPNVTDLIVSSDFPSLKTVHDKITRLKMFNATHPIRSMNTCDVCFPCLEHIEIESQDFIPNDIVKILKIFKNLKTLMLYFCASDSQHWNSETSTFINRFDKRDLIAILEKYQIKPAYDCLQFINKKQ